MPVPIDAVVFDLDGTLVDSCADIAMATNHALVRYGFAPRHVGEIASFVGDGVHNLIRRASGLASGSQELDLLVESFVAFYAEHAADQTRLMPGAREALSALEHFELAIVTNKPQQPTRALLKHLGLTDRFRIVVSGGDLPRLKPDPMPLLHVASHLGLPAERLAIVGDGPQDVECGRQAGATTIGVRGGIAASERLIAARPDYLLDSLFELPPLLTSQAASRT